jgi:hypothetical protein
MRRKLRSCALRSKYQGSRGSSAKSDDCDGRLAMVLSFRLSAISFQAGEG